MSETETTEGEPMTTKSRPIIFSADSVRAILENRKTQTRRVMKPQPVVKNSQFRKDVLWYAYKGEFHDVTPGDSLYGDLPYRIGDRLWVKEAWVDGIRPLHNRRNTAYYTATLYKATDGEINGKWNNPMFMPRWASRLTLEITKVRCERVQEITEDDCFAEGIIVNEFSEVRYYSRKPNSHLYVVPKNAFGGMWDEINGKKQGYSWKDNPWVWILEFKVFNKGE